MNYTITTEKLQEWANKAPEYRDLLKEMFPEAFDVKGWYRKKLFPDWMVYWNPDLDFWFGFNSDGKWFNEKKTNYNPLTYTFAYKIPDSEAHERLIKYAEKTYPVGTKFKPIEKNCFNEEFGLSTNRFTYFPTEDGISTGKNWVYKTGQWAEIVKEDVK